MTRQSSQESDILPIGHMANPPSIAFPATPRGAPLPPRLLQDWPDEIRIGVIAWSGEPLGEMLPL